MIPDPDPARDILRRLQRTPGARLALACAAAALCTALLWPRGTATARGPTWETLLAPLRAGSVVHGYELGPPRRGEERDVVLTARRASPSGADRVIEVHVVDRGRWTGVRETRSFGVAYEVPRTTAPLDEASAVTAEIAARVAANDRGSPPVDAIPLRTEPVPRAARVLERLAAARGVLVGLLAAAAIALLATLRRGAWWVALAVGALGFALRAAHLGVPFVRDQDVQRALTGRSSLGEILTGIGIRDRHPPLYFLVLHVAQWFGQSESVLRAPAVLAGALVAPAIAAATHGVRGRLSVGAALAALAVAASPVFVAHSREVSEIPLFALVAVVACAAVVRAAERETRATGVLVAASHAFALWTYYVAPLVLAGQVAYLAARRRLARRTAIALGIGAAIALPSLTLLVSAFVGDRSARDAARTAPGIAWGQRTAWQMASEMTTIARDALGVPVLVLFALATARAVAKRDDAGATPAAGVLLAGLGLVALTPFARLQPYYVAAALPLAALAVAFGSASDDRRTNAVVAAVLALSIGLVTAPQLSGARGLYAPDPDAFGREFAAVIARRPERRVAVVAHYDATLLAYYLARGRGASVSWETIRGDGDDLVVAGVRTRLVPLVRVHAPEQHAEAARRLAALVAREPVLVVDRATVRLGDVDAILRACVPLVRAPSANLLRCAPGAEGSRRR